MGLIISGLMELLERLENMDENLTPAIDAAAHAGAERIKADARALCPIQTGTLRDGIRADVQSDGSSVSIRVGVDSDYGMYVEHGTAKMAARPFLYPAVRMNEESIAAEIAAAVKKVIF